MKGLCSGERSLAAGLRRPLLSIGLRREAVQYLSGTLHSQESLPCKWRYLRGSGSKGKGKHQPLLYRPQPDSVVTQARTFGESFS